MKKKAQSSVEFMILLLFMLVVISLAVAVIGRLSLDLTDRENVLERDQYAQFLLREFEISQRAQGGYYREVTIEPFLMERFEVSFVPPYYLVLNDTLVEGEDSRSFYYEIEGNNTFNFTIDEDTDQGILSIRVPAREVGGYLSLNSSVGSIHVRSTKG